jgi:hypothetical protein
MLKDMQLTPRERWELRYREERMRLKGYSENAINPLTEMSVGSFEGMRVVEKRSRK